MSPHQARAATGAALILGSLAFAVPASAHVKVSGTDAVQAGSGVVTFRVPSESATASTTELLITFPASTPFTSVDTQPKPGWTRSVTMVKLAKPVTNDEGETVTERAGILNLGIEGTMYVGAFSGFAVALWTGEPLAGLPGGFAFPFSLSAHQTHL